MFQPTLRSLTKDCDTENHNITEQYNSFPISIYEATKQSEMFSTQKYFSSFKRSAYFEKPWYNKKCRIAKRRLRNFYRKFKRDPSDINNYLAYKYVYKKLIK